MRVNVTAEFFVRVRPNAEAIAAAAQTLGSKTLDMEQLRPLLEGKFVDALRAVAAERDMQQLHEQRIAFVQTVRGRAVGGDRAQRPGAGIDLAHGPRVRRAASTSTPTMRSTQRV